MDGEAFHSAYDGPGPCTYSYLLMPKTPQLGQSVNLAAGTYTVTFDIWGYASSMLPGFAAEAMNVYLDGAVVGSLNLFSQISGAPTSNFSLKDLSDTLTVGTSGTHTLAFGLSAPSTSTSP